MMSDRTGKQALSEAIDFVNAWRRASSALDSKRVNVLRAMTEQESARQFSLISRSVDHVVLRTSSGLVEQQVVFDRLREQNQ